eukprot:CAMPEP_0113321294 /NCGR_PEP_ID=MMETSP0010_2-20120614/14822_1 /TAXON_ID=216773 ORGANISM="Corethron hystrix, Strain 308" /NCGR_SAMPLE_ID=MMETSP0010_2 /ASSEMBLY_ACC=CAM_ASM_000155 /LENGTH=312 /DNA_ID=CAMNT_0000179371 /DNA_START=71 /DNA_END=1009 /DNA_ORIENTATION=- /assembly_acc=CAM_ASM_000155
MEMSSQRPSARFVSGDAPSLSDRDVNRTKEIKYAFQPPPIPSIPILSSAVGSAVSRYPIRRIFCVGRNYADHAREMGGDPEREPPFFFLKPATTSYIDASNASDNVASVPYPQSTTNLHFEGEFFVALGGHPSLRGDNGFRDVSPDVSSSLIYGVGVACDLTRRDHQAAAKAARRPWCSSKGFDGSCPMGALIPLADAGRVFTLATSGNSDAASVLQLKTVVNGILQQSAPLSEMVWDIPHVLSHLSKQYGLREGDVVLTGTPAGVGPLEVGDSVDIRVVDKHEATAKSDFTTVLAPDAIPICKFFIKSNLN